MFCADQDLIVSSRIDVQRQLVKHLNCRPTFPQVRRMRGVRWRKDPQQYLDHSLNFAADNEIEQLESVHSPFRGEPKTNHSGILQEFVKENLESSHWVCYVDMYTRLGPKGDKKVGFHEALQGWCAMHNCPIPPHEGVEVEQFLEGRHWQDRRVCQLRGLEWSQTPAAPNVLSNYWVMELYTVAVHLVGMLAPTFLMLLYAMYMQDTWARTMALQRPLQWHDFFDWTRPKAGLHTYPLFTVLWIENVAYLVVAYLQIAVHYVDAPGRKAACRVFGVLNVLQAFVLCTWLGLVAVWLVLAAILAPTRFLPCGSAVVVVLLLVRYTRNTMQTAARRLRGKVAELLNERLQQDLRVAWLTLALEDKVGHGRHVLHDPQAMTDLAPLDLFNLCDADDDGVLGKDDVSRILNAIEVLALNREKVELFFTYADADGTDNLTADEFQEGWDQLVDGMLDQALEAAGLSSAQITVAIAGMVLFVCLLFVFVFLAAQGWYNDSAFNSVVQTLLVGGAGWVVTYLRKRSAAETEDLYTLAKELLPGDEDNADSEGSNAVVDASA